MGKNRGDAFARWYYAQGKRRRYVVCLVPVAMMVFGLMVIFPMSDPVPENSVIVPCGERDVYVSADDPRVKAGLAQNDLGAICLAS